MIAAHDRRDGDTEQEGALTERTLKRRGLIAGAATLAAGLLARRAIAPEDVAASDGNFLQLGHRFDVNNTASTETGLYYNGGAPVDGAILLVADTPTPNLDNPAVIGAVAGTGSVPNGITGRTLRSGGVGIVGQENGASASGIGAFGFSSNGTGVFGKSIAGNNAVGVYGNCPNGGITYGVLGSVGGGYGVLGQASSGNGVFGYSQQSHAIVGQTTGSYFGSIFGLATTPNTVAIYGSTFNGTANVGTAYAGYMDGNFVAVHGAKSAAVPHKDGSYRLLYCVESPENWFEDFGEGRLVNGKADVGIDPDFADTIHTDEYHVFLTETGGHWHLTVTSRTPTGFTVEADLDIAASKGTKASDLNGTFSWRLVARRKDIKAQRLAKFDLPKGQSRSFVARPQPPKPPR